MSLCGQFECQVVHHSTTDGNQMYVHLWGNLVND